MGILNSKRAIVTGAGSGIGREIALRFAREGCTGIGVFDLDAVAAEATVEMLKPLGSVGSVGSVHVLDIRDHERVAAEVDRFASGGTIDILVNNAGWDQERKFIDTDQAFWRKMLDINLIGQLNIHHAVLKPMIAAGGGKIVNIASDAARIGVSGGSIYAAAKGGLVAFSKSVAREVARHKINVNCVCPGPTDTPLLHALAGATKEGASKFDMMIKATPLRRLGEAADVAALVAFLASDDASFILGQTISVSGGLTMHG